MFSHIFMSFKIRYTAIFLISDMNKTPVKWKWDPSVTLTGFQHPTLNWSDSPSPETNTRWHSFCSRSQGSIEDPKVVSRISGPASRYRAVVKKLSASDSNPSTCLKKKKKTIIIIMIIPKLRFRSIWFSWSIPCTPPPPHKKSCSWKTFWSTFLVQLFERVWCSYMPPHGYQVNRRKVTTNWLG